ncbi:ATP-binding protein [Halonatronum saccharophilum]|uniref:ATP-binding protein n=1 Tax=Halonatronum saccharophilum TaxID=150060 RepID=UPI0004864022|nr:ATP-binding protein [Halonatronum saccharophilum]
MRELSLHILDIIQNSIAAQASLIKLSIDEEIEEDILGIKISDDGCGMSEEMKEKVLDPFVTSRKTRKVGLGLSLFKAIAEACEGDLELDSKLDQGTEVVAQFKYSHIDRPPLGDMVGTIITLLALNPNLDLIYIHSVDGQEFSFNTRLIRDELGGLAINNQEILSWIDNYLTEGLKELRG